MDFIDIPKKLVDLLRDQKEEHLYGFNLEENKIVNYKKLNPYDTGNALLLFVNIDVDGFAHNHFEDKGKSKIDEEYMLPGFYYLIVGPSEVYCYLNMEKITCNLY